MKFLSLSCALALFTVSTQAVQLEQEPALANLLVQTSAEIDADAEEGYGYPPHNDDPHDDDCKYYCPPALDKCPGVLQPPGPCKTALKERPLCYCNSGFMHTDWDHTVSVDDEACPDKCKKGKKPPVGYPPVHPPHPVVRPKGGYRSHAENTEETAEP